MAELRMTVERAVNDDGVPIERRGCMVARISLSDAGGGKYIELVGTQDGFEVKNVHAMLSAFANIISAKWGI